MTSWCLMSLIPNFYLIIDYTYAAFTFDKILPAENYEVQTLIQDLQSKMELSFF